ncbi:MAG: LysR family transcriptional regulator, partial [Angelakisella sp.]
MGVKLELYRVFKEVADRGSVSGAAKSLYISQSAVSQTIHQLEQQLGVRLFTRGTRGVTLTGEGTLLYQYVGTAIGLLESGEQKLLLTRSLELGELSIGASDTITLC